SGRPRPAELIQRHRALFFDPVGITFEPPLEPVQDEVPVDRWYARSFSEAATKIGVSSVADQQLFLPGRQIEGAIHVGILPNLRTGILMHPPNNTSTASLASSLAIFSHAEAACGSVELAANQPKRTVTARYNTRS
ncbi:hypothetical protein, partial [Nocardia brasiliensis]|uniref:hypothetical protein n=1 Tax=Nocardia brasiliensis TaxID=37326 RepID=UPI0033CF37C0